MSRPNIIISFFLVAKSLKLANKTWGVVLWECKWSHRKGYLLLKNTNKKKWLHFYSCGQSHVQVWLVVLKQSPNQCLKHDAITEENKVKENTEKVSRKPEDLCLSEPCLSPSTYSGYKHLYCLSQTEFKFSLGSKSILTDKPVMLG